VIASQKPQLLTWRWFMAPCLDSQTRGFDFDGSAQLPPLHRFPRREPSPRLRRLARMGEKPSEPPVSKRPTQPVTLGDMRVLGVRSVYVTCGACGYASTLNVDDEPDDVMITSFAPHMRCAKCGNLGAVVRPDWTELRGMPETRRRG
jgi:hypothetical protein